MMDMTITRDVAASPDKVWEVITDLDAAPTAIEGILSVERIDGDPGFAVGTRWRETRVMFGKETTEEMEVTAIKPGTSYTVESDGKGAHYVSTWTVAPSETGSQVIMTFGGEPTGTFSRLMAATVGKMFEGTARKAMEQDLADIAASAEAG